MRQAATPSLSSDASSARSNPFQSVSAADRSSARIASAARAVSGPLRYAPQLLVGRDLEMLEREGEARKLHRRVRLNCKERAPVDRAKAHRDVLQQVLARATCLEARRDSLLLRLRLLVVVLVG